MSNNSVIIDKLRDLHDLQKSDGWVDRTQREIRALNKFSVISYWTRNGINRLYLPYGQIDDDCGNVYENGDIEYQDQLKKFYTSYVDDFVNRMYIRIRSKRLEKLKSEMDHDEDVTRQHLLDILKIIN